MRKYAYVVLVLGLIMTNSVVRADLPIYSNVNSYSTGDKIQGQKFYLTHENDRSLENNFEYKEFSSYLRKVLTEKGMVESAAADEADVVVFFGYGIGEPRNEIYDYAVPIFGQTGVSSARTTGSFTGGNVTANTTFTPSYGLTGVVPRSETLTIYDRWLRFAAVDAQSLKSGNKPVEKWRVNVKSSGSIGELRNIVPFMIFSAKDYVGISSMRVVQVKVKYKSNKVKKLINENLLRR